VALHQAGTRAIMTRDDCLRAELIERVDFSASHAMLRFRPDRSFSYRPGQYATIALEAGEKLLPRPYSIVSSPYEPLLEFFIELVPAGVLTPRLWELKPGDRVYVRSRASGRLHLVEREGVQNHLLAATTTGIAPFISMARTYAADRQRGAAAAYRFLVVHGASRPANLGSYHDELAELSQEGWLRYVPTVSRPWDNPDWTGEIGRVEDILRKHMDAPGFTASNTVAYLVGHPQMIENARGVLNRARFSKENIEEEKFFPTREHSRLSPV
jgi:ferredoxin/flavodoxin---NADP+ reductase